ncbi:hypothetical protein PAPHI01_1451 [Pancytospora philotis]|nr:hypothetical protein PAPHI01_1451 [Pancytospora philotis]
MFSLITLISVLAQYPLVVMSANPCPSAESDILAEEMASFSLSSNRIGGAATPCTNASGASALAHTGMGTLQSKYLLERFEKRVSDVYKSYDLLKVALRQQMVRALSGYARWSYLKLDTKVSNTSRLLDSYIKNDKANLEHGRETATKGWVAGRPHPYFLRNVIACYKSLFSTYDDILSEYFKQGSEVQPSMDAADSICACAELKEIAPGPYDCYSEEHLRSFRSDADIDSLLKESNSVEIVHVQLLYDFYNNLVKQSNQRMRALLDQCPGEVQIDCGALQRAMELCAERFREVIGSVRMSQNRAEFVERVTAFLSKSFDVALSGSEERRLHSMLVDAMIESVVDKYMERVKARSRAGVTDIVEVWEVVSY